MQYFTRRMPPWLHWIYFFHNSVSLLRSGVVTMSKAGISFVQSSIRNAAR